MPAAAAYLRLHVVWVQAQQHSPQDAIWPPVFAPVRMLLDQSPPSLPVLEVKNLCWDLVDEAQQKQDGHLLPAVPAGGCCVACGVGGVWVMLGVIPKAVGVSGAASR